MIPSQIAPQNAARKPSTWKPGTTPPTSQSSSAFSMNTNSPNVRMMNGIEMIVASGRTTALMIPNASAAIRSEV
jgi:hypothetical protein